MIVLLGVLVVILGFATRRNPLLVVGSPASSPGCSASCHRVEVLAAFGDGFASSRSVTIFAITLPVIGLLERNGLQEQARNLIGKLGKLTTGRFLALYLLPAPGHRARSGLTRHRRPRAERAPDGRTRWPRRAAERKHGAPCRTNCRRRSARYAAGADKVGSFFGEDFFLAVGSILLITGFVNTTYHTHLEPLDLALWAIPTAVCAFLIHGAPLLRCWTARWPANSLAGGHRRRTAAETVAGTRRDRPPRRPSTGATAEGSK